MHVNQFTELELVDNYRKYKIYTEYKRFFLNQARTVSLIGEGGIYIFFNNPNLK